MLILLLLIYYVGGFNLAMIFGIDVDGRFFFIQGSNNETEMIWALQDIRKKNILTQLPTYEKVGIQRKYDDVLSDY